MLTGCATAPREPGQIKTVLLYPPIPYELLHCHNEPIPGGINTQEDFAIWAEQVRAAGEQCRGTVNGLRAFIYSWESSIDNMDPWVPEGEYQ